MELFWEGYILPLAWTVVRVLAIVAPLLIAVSCLAYGERKVVGAVQPRKDPNAPGPLGALQPLVDNLRLFLKQPAIPGVGAGKAVFLIAPTAAFVLSLAAWAVIPFDEGMVLADIDIGILYLFAIGSLGVCGIVTAGWASNSGYVFLGALRSGAHRVPHEISTGLIVVSVILSTGSTNLSAIVAGQTVGPGGFGGLWGWNFIWHFPVFVVFMVAMLVRTNRAPFDLPKAGDEPPAGYGAGCPSMTVALFFLGEYANMVLMSAICAILFLGGWHAPTPFLEFIPGILWFIVKICLILFVLLWVRTAFPRDRHDRLMRLGWTVFLPLSFVWMTGMAVFLAVTGRVPA